MKICVVNLLRTKRNAGTLESDNKKQYNNIQLRKDIQAEQPTASSYPTSWRTKSTVFSGRTKLMYIYMKYRTTKDGTNQDLHDKAPSTSNYTELSLL